MPTNHTGNTANGNAIGALASMTGYSLRGRLTNLPIYEIRYYTLANSPLSGPNFDRIVRSIDRDNIRDATHGYRQPTNHDDRLGNLPVAPGGRVAYREYFLPGNTLAWPGFPRLIADPGTRRLFITPTHYDVWLQSPVAAASAPVAQPIAPNAAGARNPFYLITGAGAVNDIFL